MELAKIKGKCTSFLKKYRFVAIVLLAGLLLMCLPGRQNSREEQETEMAIKETEEVRHLDETLSDILSQIKGAGYVQVLLTLQRGEETVYQTDTHVAEDAGSQTTQIDTVIISGTERNQSGLVRQINPPMYMGAIVVCQGADSPSVRLAIVEAVSKVTGLGADRISVLKMK